MEIFGEGDSRKELREINPKDAGKKKPLEERLSFVLSENVFMRV